MHSGFWFHWYTHLQRLYGSSLCPIVQRSITVTGDHQFLANSLEHLGKMPNFFTFFLTFSTKSRYRIHQRSANKQSAPPHLPSPPAQATFSGEEDDQRWLMLALVFKKQVTWEENQGKGHKSTAPPLYGFCFSRHDALFEPLN